MNRFFGRLPLQLATFAALAAASLAVTAMPVAASSACDTAQIQVEFLGVGASNTVLILGGDGYYTGSVLVHVFCGLDGSPVTGATISMYTNVAGSSILDAPTNTWKDATNSAHPVTIDVPTGDQQITVRVLDPGLSGWKARIGSDTVTVLKAFGQGVEFGDGFPNANAGIWAQTPELDSIALFGTGAMGLLGYVLLRRRARGGRS